jgi:hypothetical protein
MKLGQATASQIKLSKLEIFFFAAIWVLVMISVGTLLYLTIGSEEFLRLASLLQRFLF